MAPVPTACQNLSIALKHTVEDWCWQAPFWCKTTDFKYLASHLNVKYFINVSRIIGSGI